MMAVLNIPRRPALGAALTKVRKVMDVILHLGAHRTASTSFQAYLRDNAAALSAQGVGVWGPRRTRGGLLAGVWPAPGIAPRDRQHRRATGRVALALQGAQGQGVQQLVISDENMIGFPRANIRDHALYPAAGERVARLVAAFQGRVSRVVLSIRCTDHYWASVISMTVARGHPLPGAGRLDAMAHAPRSWRDVITDIACAAPDVPLIVMPHEVYGAVPELRLKRMLTGPVALPRTHARRCLNAAPDLPALRAAMAEAGRDPALLPAGDGAFQPFDRAQAAALQETYADDLFWLAAGADGLATLMTEKLPGSEGKTPVPDHKERGHAHDHEGRVAQAG